MSETWIRIVIYRTDEHTEQAVEYLRRGVQDVVRMLEKQPGFQLGYWGNNPKEGRMAAITYWSSKEAIQRATAALSELHKERADHGLLVDRAHNVRLFAGNPVEAVT